MVTPTLQEPHYSGGGDTHGRSVAVPEERLGLIDWPAVVRALTGAPEPNPDPYGIEERKRRRAKR